MPRSPQPTDLGHVLITWLCLTILYHTCSPIHAREQGKTNCNWVVKNTILKNNQGQILKLKQDFKCCNHRLNISDARDSAWLSNKADSKLTSKLSIFIMNVLMYNLVIVQFCLSLHNNSCVSLIIQTEESQKQILPR